MPRCPLPSSQVPYSNENLTRGNGGGRKSQVKEPEMVSACDESSTVDQDVISILDDFAPDSHPKVIRPLVRMYSGKKEKPSRSRRKRISVMAPRRKDDPARR